MIRRTFAVAALALLTLAGAASADAQNAAPTVGLPAADDVSVALDLVGYGPSVLKQGDLLSVAATVANASAATMSDLAVSISATDAPITSSAALERFLDAPESATTHIAATTPVTSGSLAVSGTGKVLPPGGTVTVRLDASPQALGMPIGTTGVYGIVVAVTGPTGAVTTRAAAVTWYDAAITPLRVAFVATASGSAERVTQVTSAASVPGAALVIDPVTVTDATEGAALTAGREVFGMPSGSPDLTSLAHAGDTELIGFALDDAATGSIPALASLPWLATIPAPDSPTIAFAAAHGATAGLLNVTGGAKLSGQASGGTAPVVDITAGDSSLALLVPDANLSTILASYRPGKPDAAARLVAEAAIEAQQGDGTTPVVVAPGDAWQLTAPGVSQPLSDLLGAPWVVPVSVKSVISGSARGTATAPDSAGAGADLAPELIQGLTRQLEDLRQLSETAAEPALVYVPGGRELLAPLALALRPDPEARSATYQATRESISATLGSLYVAEGSDVNLIAASGNVPVTLHNNLNVDATVTVVMKSSSPNLVVQDRPVVTIPAGGDKTVHVAVTGVKSANVTATVALENPAGDVVAAPQVLRVRVRADWGNAMTAVFTVGLALLLIAGLIRTVRRGKRGTRMAPMTPTEPPPPDRTVPDAAEAGTAADTGAGGGDG